MFGGLDIIAVKAGTVIKHEGEEHEVTEENMVRKNNALYVTPRQYNLLKARTAPNAKNPRPIKDAGYLYRSYDLRQWSGSRLCSILSRNHTTRRQPNQ